MSAQEVPFVKQLAANDRPTRDKAVASLRTYLHGKRKFEELELLKLWKGLFYCMWLSDRPRTQQRLAVDLAGLVDVLPDETIVPFLVAFWDTMAREWSGIDVLRMDKFLLLIRAYLNASFRYLIRTGWDAAVVQQNIAILSAIPLSLTDSKVPNGLRYHVIDIYVDELDKADSLRSSNAPLEKLLEPLRKVGSGCSTKSVRTRAKEAMADGRLKNWQNEENNASR